MEDLERAQHERKLRAYGVLSIMMMAVIFAFSSMNGDLSSSQSNGIALWLGGHLIDGFQQMSDVEKLAAIHAWTYPIRKAAHVTEYAVLGGLLVATFRQAAVLHDAAAAHMPLKVWAGAIIIAVLYACTDELHQVFVPGREGQPTDVLIDTAGILVGSLVVMCVVRMCVVRVRRKGRAGGSASSGSPTSDGVSHPMR